MPGLKIIDYMKEHDERKKVANLIQTGNVRFISDNKIGFVNVRRNRVIMVVLAVFVLLIGFYSIFF